MIRKPSPDRQGLKPNICGNDFHYGGRLEPPLIKRKVIKILQHPVLLLLNELVGAMKLK
ncbi:hypothetical protein DAPPUDRAFT_308864 [Daphnia pulex]|uniref:Uncharacterized protein n=1 Tax=Daphnia pulex TaxID=6669 RepID=E9H9P1_DAPPU|nr:hypothetical protein DAPPUDRAFT_308864 [Daphnia pulex]|eukprot:EFX71512.1 hypothetical protein DAPPUDRAFT_308864 [Daphnia pulex]